MSAVAEDKKIVVGGSFLIEERTPEETFTPEDFTEEHRMIADTARQFMDNEVRPRLAELEKKDWKLARELVQKGAEIGFVGATVAEEYGGLGLDQVAGCILGEALGRAASFATTMGAQGGIGLLPIVYYGTEEAKQKYIPRIVTGELITAYALTEAGSGSDALAAKATARLSEDGTHYVIKGEKMWITNGGFADLFVVFAKVDGDKFTGFIVERQEGLSNGAEEHKMGINGSSTTALVLDDVKTPGRKLARRGRQGSQDRLQHSQHRPLQARRDVPRRDEAGRRTSPCATPTSANSSASPSPASAPSSEARRDGDPHMGRRSDDLPHARAHRRGDQRDGRQRRPRVEAARDRGVRRRVLGHQGLASEYCQYVTDEMVQIYGGYGYSADYPAEAAYRDARINRIFEGTNEINRMLIPGMLMRRALGGKLALLPAAQGLMDEVLSPSMPSLDEDETVLAAEAKLAKNAKKVALMVLGTAAQKYMTALSEEQEVLIGASNIIMDVFAMESAILRAQKMAAAQGEEAAVLYLDMVRVFCNDAVERVEAEAKNTLAAISDGDELRTLLAALKRFTKHTPTNTVAARRRIADAMIKANRYVY